MGGPLIDICNKVNFSSRTLSKDSRLILGSNEIFEKRFYSPIFRKKVLTSYAEAVLTNKSTPNDFRNIVNPQLQDLMDDYRIELKKKRRDAIFTTFRITPQFCRWIKSLDIEQYSRILVNYKKIISKKDMLNLCLEINQNFEILQYIIYSIINSTDNAVEIALVSGIASGTILDCGKFLNNEISPSTNKFFIKDYWERFNSPLQNNNRD